MKENQILEKWIQSKTLLSNFHRLDESFSVEYEFFGQFGHPSSYAFVSFQCQPSEELSFNSSVTWDKGLSLNYIAKLEEAICEAIVDSLFSASFYSYRGCSLNLYEIKWDDIGSSEVAFYKATKGAMEKLIIQAKWRYVTYNQNPK